MQPAKALAWEEYLRFYNKKNKGRCTRLGIFENGEDYWIESGLALSNIETDRQTDGVGMTIILGNYTHAIRDVRSLALRFSLAADEDGVDITDGEGRVTTLRFEN
jgi:hypothetical protein